MDGKRRDVLRAGVLALATAAGLLRSQCLGTLEPVEV